MTNDQVRTQFTQRVAQICDGIDDARGLMWTRAHNIPLWFCARRNPFEIVGVENINADGRLSIRETMVEAIVVNAQITLVPYERAR